MRLNLLRLTLAAVWTHLDTNSSEHRTKLRGHYPVIRAHDMVTSWSGLPRKNSDGRYPAKCLAQGGHSTVMDWKGNSSTPEGTCRRHCLQVTTKVLREDGVGNMPAW